MRNLHIENSFNVWNPIKMRQIIDEEVKSVATHHLETAEQYLHRSYVSLYIEWWLHNIGYYLTKPLCFISKFNWYNTRCKDVDLEEHKL